MINSFVKDILNVRWLKSHTYHKKKLAIWLGIIMLSLCNLFFISNNQGLYHKPIGKVIEIQEQKSYKDTMDRQKEPIKIQKIKAVIMNGTDKGKTVALNNQTSFSQVNDLDLKISDEVFLSIQYNVKHEIVSAMITDLKRDQYIGYIINIFVLFILIVGEMKGFRSLVSVSVNVLIFLVLIALFKKGNHLMLYSVIASLLFIVLSILIVSGKNKKSFSAIVATLVGTFVSMLIAGIVIKVNHWSGIHFEEMEEFLTLPPETIFFIELIIGTLGAIMDIAISISSAIEELYNRNPNVERKAIIKSSREIGQDIMGTMANTLIFAYLSGSISSIILLLRNGLEFSNIFSLNLSLELTRALVGSIGIVLSIPITMYISILILKNRKVGEA